MATGSSDETNDNNDIRHLSSDIGFVIKEEVCSETDSPLKSPKNESVISGKESSTDNGVIKHCSKDNLIDISRDDSVNSNSVNLKVDEDNAHAVNEESTDGPVDYSQKTISTASKSENDLTKTNNLAQFSQFKSSLSIHSIPFNGSILYQGADHSKYTSPLIHNTDGKQMRPFKAYNASRELLSGLPPLAGYAIPVGSSPIPIRINSMKNTPVSQSSTNKTSITPQSTHLMTLATEADKLRQRECENDGQRDNIEKAHTEDGLTSDGNDSYRDDINEFYPQGLQETQKKKGKKRKNLMEDQLKDDTYWERRRKNNEAAKRSRDARRAKEDQIAIRAALLEQENMRLRIELAALKEEMIKLRSNVYGKNSSQS